MSGDSTVGSDFGSPVLVHRHHVEVIQTYQGHRVPDHGYYPNFGFAVDTPTEILPVYAPEEYPLGATAQNGMQEVRWFQCSSCGDVLREEDTPHHVCPEVTDGT